MHWKDAEREYTDEVIGETTIPRLFFDAAERHENLTCQMYKGGIYDRSLVAADIVDPAPAGEFEELDYSETASIVRTLAAGFRDLGVGADDRVSIYGDTRMEWAHSDIAVMSAGGVVTTVYTESSPQQVEYLIDDPGSIGAVVENEELLATLAEVESELDLEFVVTMDETTGGDTLSADVYTLAEVYERGQAFDDADVEAWIDERDWTELSSLVYTSGTTGDPKGVELSHKNWRSVINQLRKRVGPRPDKPADMPTMEAGKTAISFLPIAHAFERVNHFQSLGSGIALAYAESPDTLADDIKVIQPEFAAAVPRVYERIYNGLREQTAESFLKKRLFEWSVDVAQKHDRADEPGTLLNMKLGIADRLIFSKVRDAMGGNIEMFVSGGGSLSEDLARLFRSMGITIIEGYGLTETAPAVSFNPAEDIRVGTMGPPLIDVQVQLDPDVVNEETKASAEGDVGELLVKGPNVFSGYWNKPDKTAEAFDGDWFRTGDIVSLDEDEYLTFVDRQKNLLVLDTGKNIAPEPIEDQFSTSARIDQIMVVGDDQKFIGAIVVPNFEQLSTWADEEGYDIPDDPEQAIEDDRVREWIGEEIDRVNEKIAKHETIKEFALVSTEWTAENDLLTPSMKKKRRNIRSEFDAKLAEIYD